MESYQGKAAIQQRVLPAYRVPFMDALASACTGGLAVAAGAPRSTEMIETGKSPSRASLTRLRNIHLLEGRAYFCYQNGLTAWLNAEKPSALILEANPRYLSTPQAMQWMHSRCLPVLGWGLGAPDPAHSLSFIWKNFLKSFDGMISYSQAGAESYLKYGFSSDRVFIAPNAVAARPAAHPAERPPHLTRPLTVLFVGRLQERKRIDLLLKACAAQPEGQKPRLVIVGDGPARSAFEAAAQTEYPSAEFVGAKYGAELEPFYQQADLFVLPGTGGLAVQQAMSFALPVIVARGDGTQSDLVRPANGWQILPDDLAALQNTLSGALADLPRLRTMGEESYRIVAEEINLENMVNSFVAALNQTGVRQ
jgi:glycosyltransferase involved in cell wall biosynthesis